jgi:hypothetical protein
MSNIGVDVGKVESEDELDSKKNRLIAKVF